MIIKLFRYLLDNTTEFQWHCVKFALALAVIAGAILVVVNHPAAILIGALALFVGVVLFAIWKFVA